MAKVCRPQVPQGTTPKHPAVGGGVASVALPGVSASSAEAEAERLRGSDSPDPVDLAEAVIRAVRTQQEVESAGDAVSDDPVVADLQAHLDERRLGGGDNGPFKNTWGHAVDMKQKAEAVARMLLPASRIAVSTGDFVAYRGLMAGHLASHGLRYVPPSTVMAQHGDSVRRKSLKLDNRDRQRPRSRQHQQQQQLGTVQHPARVKSPQSLQVSILGTHRSSPTSTRSGRGGSPSRGATGGQPLWMQQVDPSQSVEASRASYSPIRRKSPSSPPRQHHAVAPQSPTTGSIGGVSVATMGSPRSHSHMRSRSRTESVVASPSLSAGAASPVSQQQQSAASSTRTPPVPMLSLSTRSEPQHVAHTPRFVETRPTAAASAKPRLSVAEGGGGQDNHKEEPQLAQPVPLPPTKAEKMAELDAFLFAARTPGLQEELNAA